MKETTNQRTLLKVPGGLPVLAAEVGKAIQAFVFLSRCLHSFYRSLSMHWFIVFYFPFFK